MENKKKIVYTTIGTIAGILMALSFGAYASNTGNTEKLENNTNEIAILSSKASITKEQAKITANTSYKGNIKNISLDDEDGIIVYSLEYTDGTDVKVDANTNVVVKIDKEDSNENNENNSNENGKESSNEK